MARCETCMTNPVHPDKKCCFNCAKSGTNCEVWHNCGEDCPGWDRKVVTNADRIRAMGDEELGIFLGEWADNPWAWKRDVEVECLAWLQQPAEDL